MKAQDVTDTLDLALAASGCDQVRIVHKPCLLSDNGFSYVSAELEDWLTTQNMGHVRGAPYHPQTQGKIERRHQTLKNRILLENYYLSGALEASIGRFVDHYNHRRYHESLSNLTPADVYFGRGQTIPCWKEKGSNGAQSKNDACSTKGKPHKLKPDEPVTPVNQVAICLKLSDDGQSAMASLWRPRSLNAVPRLFQVSATAGLMAKAALKRSTPYFRGNSRPISR